MKCCHDLRQGFVDRPGQLDAVVLVDTDQCVTGRGRCPMTALVSRQEPDHRCEFLRMLREEGRGLDRFGTHRSSPPIRMKRNYFRDVRILSHMTAPGPPRHPAVTFHRLSTRLLSGANVGNNCERICERNAAQLPRWRGTQSDGWDGR